MGLICRSDLEKLCEYATDPSNGIWVAPIGTIAQYVKDKRESMSDTLNLPGIVRPSPDSTLNLTAEKGKATGSEIKYMPEWKAFGWFTAADRVEWDVEVTKGGKYDVFLEWSVSDEEAGKPFIFEAGNQQLEKKAGKTGS
jgi:hypothetical protein